MKKIQITSISQAIELLKKAKTEYRELEEKYHKTRQELHDLKKHFSETKMPAGFEKLFGSLRK